MRTQCGCCKSGVEYVARHVDDGGFMPLGMDPMVLAREYIDAIDPSFTPPHLPDEVTLGLWMGAYQVARRDGLQATAA